MKKRIAFLFLILGLNSSAFALSTTDFGLTPFLVYGEHFSLGVETNRWWMLLDPGWSPENNGNTLMSRMLFAGYGFRLYYDYSEDHEDGKEHHGVYFSPMASVDYTAFGLSVGPDIGLFGKKFDYGVSVRVWFLLVGAEVAYTVEKSTRLGFYLYFPVHFPASYYF
jgi:hypothetical protein